MKVMYSLLPVTRCKSLLARCYSSMISSYTDNVPELDAFEVREKMLHCVGGKAYFDAKLGRAMPSVPVIKTTDIKPQPMRASFVEVNIPLSDPKVRESYLNAQAQIRFGRLLEDMDTISVFSTFKHNEALQVDGVLPVNIVTLMVDDIVIDPNVKIDPLQDLILSAHVTYVGRSSIEVTMEMVQLLDGKRNKYLDSRFTMVAIDPATNRASPVSPLLTESPEEDEILIASKKRVLERKAEMSDSLLQTPPKAEESSHIHELFSSTVADTHSFKSRVLPANACWMGKNLLKNVIICQPEHRNIYGRIFGGFLMRQAYELAWSNAYMFSGVRTKCVFVDDIWFRKPVEIGSFLLLSTIIGYTEDHLMQSRVHASVVHPESGSRVTTNVLNFTFATPSDSKPLQKVYPRSYGESMLYVDARRRVLNLKSLNDMLQ